MSCVSDECGFGERSIRYSAVVNDCVIEQIFIESAAVISGNQMAVSNPNLLSVSTAENMIVYLSSAAPGIGRICRHYQ